MDEILKKHMEDQAENEVRFAEHAKEIGSLKHRMDNVEKLTESIQRMTVSVDCMCKELKAQGKRIDRLELAPGDRWNKLVDTAIACVASGIIGYFIAGLL